MAPPIRPSSLAPVPTSSRALGAPQLHRSVTEPVLAQSDLYALTQKRPSAVNPHQSAMTIPGGRAPSHVVQERNFAPPSFVQCIKASYPYKLYENVVRLRVLHLLSADALHTRYTMSETQKAGAYGKIKYAYNEVHERRALKEMRLVAARNPDGVSKFNRPKTKPMALQDVFDEAERTVIVRTVIDSALAARIAGRRGQDPLGALRTGISPYHVYTVVRVEDKMYMETTLESGDLAALRPFVALSERRGFATSAAAQLFAELRAMHGSRYAHLDIKAENLLFGASGQVKIADFGLACSVLPGEAHVGVRGVIGTIPAPEMLLTDDDMDDDGNWQSILLTEAVDVWLAAVTTLQLLDPGNDAHNPLLYQYTSEDQIDTVATSTRLAHFEVWRREALDAQGHIKPEVLVEDDIFSRYFARLYTLAPALCDVLLAKALVGRVDLRASAHDLAGALEALVVQMSPARRLKTQQVFARGHVTLGQDAVFAQLEQYQSWLSEQL